VSIDNILICMCEVGGGFGRRPGRSFYKGIREREGTSIVKRLNARLPLYWYLFICSFPLFIRSHFSVLFDIFCIISSWTSLYFYRCLFHYNSGMFNNFRVNIPLTFIRYLHPCSFIVFLLMRWYFSLLRWTKCQWSRFVSCLKWAS
jgi:hypothetical protein